MIGLTTAQAELLYFIRQHTERTGGVAPSFEDMKQHLGLASKSGIHRLICALVERGHLRRIPNRARALEVLDVPTELEPLANYTSAHLIAELARRGVENRRAA